MKLESMRIPINHDDWTTDSYRATANDQEDQENLLLVEDHLKNYFTNSGIEAIQLQFLSLCHVIII